MLNRITIEGFKSIKCVEELELGRINVLIGPNGSGKSNFIGALSFLQTLRAGGLRDYVAHAGGADRILHFGSKTTEYLKLHTSFESVGDAENEYEIALAATASDELYPATEIVYVWNKARYPERPFENSLAPYGNEAGISDPASEGIAWYVRRHLDGWRLYHFHDTSPTSPMKKTGDVHDNRGLRPDGANLAPFLYYLREKHNSAYILVRDAVRLAAPFFDDFMLEPLALNENKIRLEWRHAGSDAYFDASSLSDGSLRFIALAVLLLQPKVLRPSTILLDEPEIGLHPYAITLLSSLIEQASAETQVILATQSSLLLDHFAPEDVLVADRTEGRTEFTRLDPEKLEVWLEDYSLGQLWEKNEIGGRPNQGPWGDALR